MKYTKIQTDLIRFIAGPCDEKLTESIVQRGLALPLRVKKEAEGYCCIDGNKRLRSIQAIRQHEPQQFTEVYCIVVNDGSLHSEGCWDAKNRH